MNMQQPNSIVFDTEQRAKITRHLTMVSVITDLLLSVVKILIGIIGHSQSVIADGVHSLSDLLSDFVLLYAGHHSQQAADSQHPYGHGKFETAATLALASLLVLVAAGMIWEYAYSLFDPPSLLHPDTLTLVIIIISIVAKEWLYHYTRIAAKRIRSDMMMANAWHHRSDAASSLVVLIGLAGTMAGLVYMDAVAAIIVAVMIAKIGFDLAMPALKELVDTGLDAQRVQEIRNVILAVGGVTDLHMLRTRRIGGSAAADVHVLVEPWLSVSEGHMIGLMVEQSLKQTIDELEDITVHIDPEDDDKNPSCLNLPLRTEALSRIKAAWQPITQAQACYKLVLHYLSGKIEIDAYFPLDSIINTFQTEELAQNLHQALANHSEFRCVRIYFGQSNT